MKFNLLGLTCEIYRTDPHRQIKKAIDAWVKRNAPNVGKGISLKIARIKAIRTDHISDMFPPTIEKHERTVGLAAAKQWVEENYAD